MPGIVQELSELTPPPPESTFAVSHQKLHLDINLLGGPILGSTTLTINPRTKILNEIGLNCRQCIIKKVTVSGKNAAFSFRDPYERMVPGVRSTVHQHHQVRERLAEQLKARPEPELLITIPKSVRIEDLDPRSIEAPDRLASFASSHFKRESDGGSIGEIPQSAKSTIDLSARYTALNVYVEYEISEMQDGIQYVGCEGGDLRYPHAYTKNSILPGSACSLFPCIDDCTSRSTWEISVKCARTLGDALRPFTPSNVQPLFKELSSANKQTLHGYHRGDSTNLQYTDEDRALDIVVIGSGDTTDEIVDPHDASQKTTTFMVTSVVSPQQIGFVIGPFEHIDLGEFRQANERDRVGQNSVPLGGFCLPGRASEVRNTCLPMAKAIDFFTITYGSFPFSNYSMCFVDDLGPDVLDTACLSICSTRLLFPEDVIDSIDEITRELVHALAAQWVGVDVVAETSGELWAIIGVSYFMTDVFLKKLSGNNEYRYRQKRAADRVAELDQSRPSLADHGACVGIDPSFLDFMKLKAPLVLFILDRRLTKASGSSGVSRIISRVLLNAKVGELPNGAISNTYFMRTCERLGHAKLDTFFNQWVFGSGCPKFHVTQKFNKKKLVVEITIDQKQTEVHGSDLKSETFMRDVKEDFNGVFAGDLQQAFQGPMTIRIHEADGTPYEHIIEVREPKTRIEIPYNTKYKRLKRGKRQKDKATEGVGVDYNVDETGDSLLYCLGDVLQSEEEMKVWRLADWSPDDVNDMSNEHYEWVRMDADFEWICQMTITMKGYMFLSQLQQDRDVVAQLQSVQALARQNPHRFVSTIFVRTLMDPRYFHGIRTEAALALAKHGVEELNYIGLYHLEKAFQELFCLPDSTMPQPNDFYDRPSYFLQCAIPKAISKVRDPSKKSPYRVRDFLYEKLRYNDNTDNIFSDANYLSTLMLSIAEAVAAQPPMEGTNVDTDFFNDFDSEPTEDTPEFRMNCINEMDRHRRIDEWIPSHHNILSRTALKCKRILIQSQIFFSPPSDFLQYASDDTSAALRISALSEIIALDGGKNRHILRLLISVLSTDPSPYIRSHVFQLFQRAISALAIGPLNSDSLPQQEGLIIEQDTSTEARHALIARRKTIPGALLALKTEIGNDTTIKEALWRAIQSPVLSINEIVHLLDICSILYEPENRLMIMLKYPRYWGCKRDPSISRSDANSRTPTFWLRFTPSRVRTSRLPPLHRIFTKPVNTVPPPVPISHRPTLKLKFGGAGGSTFNAVSTPQVGAPALLPTTLPTPVISKTKLVFKAPSRNLTTDKVPSALATPAAISRPVAQSKASIPKKGAVTPKHSSPPRLKIGSRQPSNASTTIVKQENGLDDDRSPEVEGKKRMTIKLKIGPGTKGEN